MSIQETNQLLRFTTAGSVDDGKSTLIGRLLYDSKSIFEDQIEAVKTSSEKKGFDYVDLSLLTDGLKSEREQGITIDVAYRYFATPKRKFIIADTPGHIQYTRNMVTGASTANLAIILIDARKGLLEQTFRHSFIASLLKIPHVIVCVNKMDLVDYDEEVYQKIVKSYKDFASKMEIKDVHFVPISALNGDNVVDRSTNMKWYEGPTLLYLLENVHIASDFNHIDCRFPVQMVIRPHTHEHQDFRGYAGRIEGGIFKPGDDVKVLPTGFTSKIKSIELDGEAIEEAFSPMSVTMTLEDELDISRGDMLVRPNNVPNVGQDLDVMVCWMSTGSLKGRTKLILKHTTQECQVMVREILYKVNVNTLHREEGIEEIGMNDIARISIRSAKPLFFDAYRRNRQTGSIILIDPNTNETVAAGMVI
ncbi:MAG: GTP-binding protein [Cytophagales bacterium]|uniref:sulfate adenylyltransferase subunit 1 n=1 Tax=Cyclobacterium marinum TaxID=104 RepID=UPI0011EE87E7|nr:GTP-binding protein [Cyclobacterium marinum]MBI0398612.1 GTP-binding protein [Cyclobacterium marinum]MBR9777507.1 GTP-binding protein [Cytophagales bacterium]|tara:strand:+ start:75472 stop:76731 length:1260 start_codon:yes stop_codon:yes gene_type:complete